MITAGDIRKKLNQVDPRFDEIIERVLVPRFLSKNTPIITETVDSIKAEFSVDDILVVQRQLKLRGFSTKVFSPDRPCAEVFIEIRIPPGDE